MGCSSSQLPLDNHTQQDRSVADATAASELVTNGQGYLDIPAANGSSSASSEDSGIESNCGDAIASAPFPSSTSFSTTFDKGDRCTEIGKSKGGIAFEIVLNTSHKKQHRIQSHLEKSHHPLPNMNLSDNYRYINSTKRTSSSTNQIVKKQEAAAVRREAAKHQIISKQKRRDLRALKVQQKKLRAVIEEEDEWSEVDDTFNAEYEYNWDDDSSGR